MYSGQQDIPSLSLWMRFAFVLAIGRGLCITYDIIKLIMFVIETNSYIDTCLNRNEYISI